MKRLTTEPEKNEPPIEAPPVETVDPPKPKDPAPSGGTPSNFGIWLVLITLVVMVGLYFFQNKSKE